MSEAGFLPVNDGECNGVSGEKSKLISLRVETDVLRRLQALARKQHKGYQTLLKQFVIERLIEEESNGG